MLQLGTMALFSHTSISQIKHLGLALTYLNCKLITVVSQASTHGRSQLKHQKLGVGGYTGDVLSYHTRILCGGWLHARPLINRRTIKIKGWALAGAWVLAWDNTAVFTLSAGQRPACILSKLLWLLLTLLIFVLASFSFYFLGWYFTSFPSTSISEDEYEAPCVCVCVCVCVCAT